MSVFTELLMLHSETPSKSYPSSFIEYCDWEKNCYDASSAAVGGGRIYFKVLLVFVVLKGTG